MVQRDRKVEELEEMIKNLEMKLGEHSKAISQNE